MTIFVSSKLSIFKLNSIFKYVVAAAFVVTTQVALAHSSYGNSDQTEMMVDTIRQGNLVEIKQLFSNGLNVNEDIESDGTPLIIAIQSGNRKAVEYMLDIGADINLESETDGSPLVAAALNNNLELVKFLLNQGAVIDAVTEHDETALISASREGNYEVVKYLVENGADVNLSVEAKVLKGTELRSPLNGAKTKQIRDYLIAQGANS